MEIKRKVRSMFQGGISKNEPGFTLIELLIVIAIIGILASIVLVSLGSARTKAKKASVQSSVASVSPAGVLCSDGNASMQDGNGADPICSDAAVTDAVYPTINVCGAAATDSSYTVANAGTDDWTVSLTACTGVPECADPINGNSAICGKDGCVFSGACQ